MLSLSKRVTVNIVEGLGRKTLRVPDVWAEKCRVMAGDHPGPYRFKYTPWTREMMNTMYEDCVGQKCAQAGFTEVMLNKALFTIDQQRRSVLYLLPNTKPDASDFTQSRFNPALELSPHLASMFSSTDNMGLKRSGEACLYIRGSRSRVQLKSIPVSLVIADEVDEMDQEALSLAQERMSGQIQKQYWKISTPSIPGIGVNKFFEDSTKENFTFKCPYCSKHITLFFPDCLEITADDARDPNIRNSFYKCNECDHEITKEDKFQTLQNGFWVPSESQRNIRGFHVNQMYSHPIAPWEFALHYLRGLTNVADEQEFYNSKLGLTRIVSGSNLSEGDIRKCIGTHKSQEHSTGFTTLGIDVGKELHVQVRDWKPIDNPNSTDVNDRFFATVVAAFTVKDSTAGFPELDKFIQAYRPRAVVIDSMPEKKSSYAFCCRWPGIAYMCTYSAGSKARNFTLHDEDKTIAADRTLWLDTSLGRFRNGLITLPTDINKEFIDHQSAPIRVYRKDKDGHDISRYENSKPDHYAHAGVYAEMALKIAHGKSSGSTSVESPLG